MLHHISFYRFVHIQDLEAAAQLVKQMASELTGLVLLANEGINGTLAGTAELLDAFENALTTSEATAQWFSGMVFKRTVCQTPPFARLKVAKKRQIVDMGVFGVDASQSAGVLLKPQQWRELIARDDVVLIDNRNSFEYRLGHFNNAIDPQVTHFRNFPAYLEENLPQWQAQGKKVAMYCTGGIRCEKTAAWLQTKGVTAYQLEGGIISYFRDMPDADQDWQGECFVFDNRVALDTQLKETGTSLEQVYANEPDGTWRLERANRLKREVRQGVTPHVVNCPKGPWSTFMAFLCQRFPMVNAEIWRQRLTNGEVVTAAGEIIAPQTLYMPKTQLLYYRLVESEARVPFEHCIVFANDRFVIADKPHFLPVIPAGRYVSETLLVRLRRELNCPELMQAHRIDRETAGLVLFTRQGRYRNAYQSLFRKRSIKKNYEAIAPYSTALQFPMVLEQSLVQAEHFMQMRVDDSGKYPINARVNIHLLECSGNLARYSLTPETGVRHQLRVQMNSLNLPILNDQIYPLLKPEPPLDQWETQYAYPLQLLAKHLEFFDPITGEFFSFESQFHLQSF